MRADSSLSATSRLRCNTHPNESAVILLREDRITPVARRDTLVGAHIVTMKMLLSPHVPQHRRSLHVFRTSWVKPHLRHVARHTRSFVWMGAGATAWRTQQEFGNGCAS
jgi:hypothetical protein